MMQRSSTSRPQLVRPARGLTRRGFLAGLASALAAPAIVKAASLMPVKAMPDALTLDRLHDIINAMRQMQPFPQLNVVAVLEATLYEDVLKARLIDEFQHSYSCWIIKQVPLPWS